MSSRAMPELKIAIQMDPLEGLDTSADSTIAIALEAQKRGFSLFHYLPRDLSLIEGEVVAHARSLKLLENEDPYFGLGSGHSLNLKEVDVVLMRQDPPFDMAYISATHLLENIHAHTLVVNDPAEVRNAPEKLLVTRFKEFMPPTLITRRREEIANFRARHGEIIIKPLYGNGGAGVFRIEPESENLNALLEVFEGISNEPLVVQKYLPEVRAGDKRIILVDGKAAGALNRVPAEGESRSNLHVGGRAEKADLSDRDRAICDAVGPYLAAHGLLFTGLDVIGEYLTEINVTSPTGIQEIRSFGGPNIAGQIWDAILARLGD